MARFHWTTKPDYNAACDHCGWTSLARNAQGSAALHHDRTGHTVRVEVTRSVIYELESQYRKRNGKPAQGKLL